MKNSLTKVRCEICNFEEVSIVNHLRDSHQLSVRQYMSQFAGSPVASDAVYDAMRRIPKELSDQLLTEASNAIATTTKFAGVEIKVVGNQFVENQNRIPKLDPCYDPSGDAGIAIEALELGENVFLTGPTGCGKSSLIINYCAVAQRPMMRFNCHGQLGVQDFEGVMEIKADKSTGFRLGALPEAMRMGAVFLCDEYDYAKPQVQAVTQRVLESGHREILIPGYSNEPIKAHPAFRFVATGNTTGRGDGTGLYVGTQIMNEAMLGRFQTYVKLEYLPKDKEIDVIKKKHPAVDVYQISKLVDFANKIRESSKKEEVHAIISTRDLLDNIIPKVMRGVPMGKAIQIGFANRLSEEDGKIVTEVVQHVFGGGTAGSKK